MLTKVELQIQTFIAYLWVTLFSFWLEFCLRLDYIVGEHLRRLEWTSPTTTRNDGTKQQKIISLYSFCLLIAILNAVAFFLHPLPCINSTKKLWLYYPRVLDLVSDMCPWEEDILWKEFICVAIFSDLESVDKNVKLCIYIYIHISFSEKEKEVRWLVVRNLKIIFKTNKYKKYAYKFEGRKHIFLVMKTQYFFKV